MMRIGEAAAAAGMTTKTLRFYEDSGLLPAAKRSSNGYRDYTEDSVARLEFIRRGRAARFFEDGGHRQTGGTAGCRRCFAVQPEGEVPGLEQSGPLRNPQGRG